MHATSDEQPDAESISKKEKKNVNREEFEFAGHFSSASSERILRVHYVAYIAYTSSAYMHICVYVVSRHTRARVRACDKQHKYSNHQASNVARTFSMCKQMKSKYFVFKINEMWRGRALTRSVAIDGKVENENIYSVYNLHTCMRRHSNTHSTPNRRVTK